MASQDSSPTPPSPQPPQPLHSHPAQQPPVHHQQQQPPHTILMGPPPQQSDVTAYPNNLMPYQHQQNPQLQFPFNSGVTDSGAGEDSSSPPPTDGPVVGFSSETAKKKRGRPRKNLVDGEAASRVALGLPPTPVIPGKSSSAAAVTDSCGGGVGGTNTSDKSEKRRGRPPGSVKKQIDSLGSSGMGFTPHVIIVNAGEDVASKIVEFTHQGPRTVCVLSANGTICNVTLRLPGSSNRTVTYEGRFEIISLLGSFLVSESTGGLRVGGLSVSLAGADGRVLGGGVAGSLMAAAPVQVIVGSFMIQDVKKPKLTPLASPASIASAGAVTAPSFGGDQVMAGASPPSEGGAFTNSSGDENNSETNNGGGGSYGNSSQPMQDIALYDWGNSPSVPRSKLDETFPDTF